MEIKNTMGKAEFIRFMDAAPTGYTTLYFIPADKTYGEVQRMLTATVCKVAKGLKITMSQVILAEIGAMTTTTIKVTKI